MRGEREMTGRTCVRAGFVCTAIIGVIFWTSWPLTDPWPPLWIAGSMMFSWVFIALRWRDFTLVNERGFIQRRAGRTHRVRWSEVYMVRSTNASLAIGNLEFRLHDGRIFSVMNTYWMREAVARHREITKGGWW